MPDLTLSVLDQRVELHFEDSATRDLLEVAYGHLAASEGSGELRFEIESTAGTTAGDVARTVRWTGGHAFRATDDGEFLVELEAALTIELQKLRPDLYFVHSAVLERDGRAVMLAGQPGSGKSTTCWALLHRGFRYLSDELGPTEVESGVVHPYARGLVLKKDPPAPFGVPPGALRTPRTIHIPVGEMPAGPVGQPRSLAAIVFLDYRGPGFEASLRKVSAARAGAQLYTHALNALAHSGEGLDAALAIAGRVECFELVSSDLEASCDLISEAADDLSQATPGRGCRLDIGNEGWVA